MKTSVIHKHTNRLIDETSPYLLQHAHNPVDWFAWSDEAFKLAVQQDKPIFLSIGYSTCHWCHVMEHESFSDENIADVMNTHFISIKVDREQRPDVDELYMSAVQVMTGAGGWPLSVFLTPEGKPFFGGTYFPPRGAFGRPSFKQVLLTIADVWKNKRQELADSAGRISEALKQLSRQKETDVLSQDILTDAKSYFQSIFNSTYGGFGDAPKFPQPSNLSMLLNYWYRTKDGLALDMVKLTLDAMANGGLYDHLGGGFHRYSTDAQWLVPHFEKMLYDQALLSKCYIQAYQVTADENYAQIAKETFDYVLRDMADPQGGFYSAEDADSDGKEGLFYLWQPDEIIKLLGAEKAEIFNEYYGITDKGNFEDNKSILNISYPVEELVTKFKKERSEIEQILAEGRRVLLEHRSKRTRPYRDDKIITGWNGLMISSLAYSGAVLEEQRYINVAEKAAQFIMTNLYHNGRLSRYYCDGQAVGLGVLDDYAFTIMGLLDLYEATFNSQRLVEAIELVRQMIDLFSDENNEAFYLTGRDTEPLIVRTKPGYDSALPNGNSIAAIVLLKLGKLTMNSGFSDRAERLLNAFSGRLRQSPSSLTAMLTALDFQLGPTQEIVIVGDIKQADTKQMLKLICSKFLPHSVILFHDSGTDGKAIEGIVPFIKDQTAIEGKATAHICQNYVCKQPVNNISALEKLLSMKIGHRKDD
jgi:uncharacterized protein YyaL (SSP411 family)